MKELNEIEANEISERDNLAVVYTVERLEAIPGKSFIEIVHMKDCSYTAICQKGHKVGDKVVFIVYDSIVPKNELFEFMSEFKYRVKSKSFTERDEDDNVIKKIYSQGIVIPLNSVIDFTAKRDCNDSEIDKEFQKALRQEGDDLTTFLEIKKYIAPVSNSGSSFGVMSCKGDFPTNLVSKTDEVRLANKMRALDEIKGKRVYISLKIEGSSLTTLWDDSRDELMVCSRNNQIGEHETNKFWQAINKYGLKEKLIESPYILQAECAGPGIQKNKLSLPEAEMFVFNIVDSRTRELLNYDLMISILDGLAVPMVPVILVIDNFDWTFDQLQEFADVQRYENGELAEGIVVRPCEPFFSQVLKQIWSVKLIGRDYKL